MLGRRALEPPPPPRSVSHPQASQGATDVLSTVGPSGGGGNGCRDGQLGGGEAAAAAAAGGAAGLTRKSPRRGRAAGGDDEEAPALRGRVSELGSEGRQPKKGGAGEGGYGDGGRQGAGRDRGKRKGAEGVGGDAEPNECLSREMFVIGGAGTDPIRVRTGGETGRYLERTKRRADLVGWH